VVGPRTDVTVYMLWWDDTLMCTLHTCDWSFVHGKQSSWMITK